MDFQKIIDTIQVIFPEKWNKIVYMIEYTTGSYSMRCYAKQDDNKYVDCAEQSNLSSIEIIKLFKELNNIISITRNELEGDMIWNSMTILLDNSGNFKAEYDYENHDEFALEYIAQWKEKYLN